jgi:hypothetical protein
MNSLIGLLATPTAATVADLAGRTAKVAASPFDLLLKAAVGATDSIAPSGSAIQTPEKSEGLEEEVARQLQELLESLGVPTGDCVTLRIDDASSGVSVDDDHPSAAAIDDALRGDAELSADIRRLAEINGLFDGSPFISNSKLRVEVAEDQSAALLDWR